MTDAFGISAEAGELVEIIKKILFTQWKYGIIPTLYQV
jgi:hypothetical protein